MAEFYLPPVTILLASTRRRGGAGKECPAWLGRSQ
jgi:hypothetical protein